MEIQLIGLLHDASEAYLCDIPRPIKPFITNYFEIEKILQDEIYKKFLGRLPTELERTVVKKFDNEALLYEAEHFIEYNDWKWKDSEITVQHRDYPPYAVKRYFKYLFGKITEEIRIRSVPHARNHNEK